MPGCLVALSFPAEDDYQSVADEGLRGSHVTCIDPYLFKYHKMVFFFGLPVSAICGIKIPVHDCRILQPRRKGRLEGWRYYQQYPETLLQDTQREMQFSNRPDMEYRFLQRRGQRLIIHRAFVSQR